jgi:dTDP-4-dehydrorhamnose 3,5-epimerase-like enzyme
VKTIRDLRLQTLKSHRAMGTLVPVEAEKDIPIPIRRTFYVYGTERNTLRGEHAHKECTQVLVCLNGRCEVECDDGTEKVKFVLSAADQYLLIPPGIWASEFYQNENTILLVFADKTYDAEDYIRNYDAFIRWRNSTTKKAA